MSFLVLGSPECKFCKHAVRTLQLVKKNYKYVDLYDVYGAENWRNVFTDFSTLISGQKSIPLIFKGDLVEKETLTPEQLKASVTGLEFVGGFKELTELLDDDDDFGDDDY